MQVTIDTPSRDDARIVAASLPGSPTASSVRGYGIVRMLCRSRRELQELLHSVDEVVQQHQLRWARVRYEDEEHFFRGSGRDPSLGERARQSPPQSARPTPRQQSLTDLVAERTRKWTFTSAAELGDEET